MTDLMFGLNQEIHKTGSKYIAPAVVNTLLLNVCIDARMQPSQLPPKLYELYKESKERERLAAGGEVRPYHAAGLVHLIGGICTSLMSVDTHQ
jgi:hypothetical protein